MNYSSRKMTMGSTRVARRAGSQQAESPIRVRSKATTPKVLGSVLETPYKRFFRTRVVAQDDSRPTNRPPPIKPIPWRTTMPVTLEALAPSAIRNAISRMRCETE